MAEFGNMDEFKRLYEADNERLALKDHRGRTVMHQAALKNRINILEFIQAHGGDFHLQDLAGNTPLHVAVESEALDAVEFLLNMLVECLGCGVMMI